MFKRRSEAGETILLSCWVRTAVDVTLFEIVQLTHLTTPRVRHDDLTGTAERTVCYRIDWLLQHSVNVFTALAGS